jgi:GNAT superfamily N-acetyltransferase
VSIDFDIPASGFSIRPATPADAKPLRMLLSGMAKPAVSFVAVDRRHGLVVGAAAASRALRRQSPVGPGVDVHVIPPARRCGIGRNLLVHLAAAARSGGAAALYGARRVEVGGEEMRAWERLRFHRLRDRRAASPPARSARAAAHAPHPAHPPPRAHPAGGAHRPALPGRPARPSFNCTSTTSAATAPTCSGVSAGRGDKPFLPQYSRVLMVGDQVRGCLLGHRKDAQTMVIDANIVDSSLRGGWANVWIKLEAALGVRHLKIRTLEFTTFDRYFDTRSFTEKLGGETIASSALMVLPIARGANPREE